MGRRHRGRLWPGAGSGSVISPSVEIDARGVGIDAGHQAVGVPCRRVMSVIAQHVAQCVSDLSWRLEDVLVVAVLDDPSPATDLCVEASGQADPQPLHAPGEGLSVLGLDDEVQVMSEQGKVDDPEDTSFVCGQDAELDDAGELSFPQVGQFLCELEADVHGPACSEPGTSQV